MAESTEHPNTLRQAFLNYDREVIIRNVKVGCLLGILLMPAGTVLDYFVYWDHTHRLAGNWQHGTWGLFLKFRFLSSLLIGVFFLVVCGPLGKRHPRPLGILLAMFPTFFISLMIYWRDGSSSLYYAGLNLVLLVIGFVLYWTLLESAIAVSLVLLMYVAACWLHGPIEGQVFANNLYFLILTGIIVMTGSWFHSRSRFREFALLYELNQKKSQLEASNEQLNQKRGELELSNTQLEATLKELKLAQNQLVQNAREKSRDEALTQISSGILHDVGNLMAPVANYLFKLKGVAPALPEERRSNYLETLTKLERPLNVARGVLASLQRYAHAGPQMTEECSIRALADDALAFVRGKTEELGVQVTCQVDDAFTVLGHPVDLTMVIKNLLDNALQAIEAKGSADGPGTILIEGRVGPEHNELRIRDSGTGIPAENLKRIFEPYYTTRAGVGTGLGLSNCQRIMKALGGTIQVRTEAGSFTEFVLAFPNKVGATETAPTVIP